MGTVDELAKQTGGKNLEESFLKLTGSKIRDEDVSTIDQLRAHRQMWRRR